MATAPSKVQQVKFKVGDTSLNYPFLADSTYDWLLDKNRNNIIKAAVEALEMIINQIALSPESIKTDAVDEVKASVPVLERRLNALKKQLTQAAIGASRFPFIVHSDRKNWNDFDSLFPKRRGVLMFKGTEGEADCIIDSLDGGTFD